MTSRVATYFILLISLFITSYSHANTENQERTAILNRIKPVGDVFIEGEIKKAAPAAPEKIKEAKAVSGEETFNKYCTVCHSAGVAGAPKKGDQQAWEPRVKDGIAKLVESATAGKNAMPPKGTCATCSSEDLKAAIIFMLPSALVPKS
jgi:cytochrome c5